jgi:hypothetical protein
LAENGNLFTSFTPQKASTFVLFARAGWSIRGDCFVANGDPDCDLTGLSHETAFLDRAVTC